MPPEFVIKGDGRVYKRPVAMTVEGEAEIDLAGPLLQNAQLSIQRRTWNAFNSPAGPVHVCTTDDNGGAFLSVTLASLILRCTIEVSEGIAVPTFQKEGSTVELQWNPPADCQLVYVLYCPPDNGAPKNPKRIWAASVSHLFAFHRARPECFRLPLPNLFADCRICTGTGDYAGKTMQDLFLVALDNFQQAQWNSDLLDGDNRQGIAPRREEMKTLFRFRPTGSGFEPLPSETPWMKLSDKVGLEILSSVMR